MTWGQSLILDKGPSGPPKALKENEDVGRGFNWLGGRTSEGNPKNH